MEKLMENFVTETTLAYASVFNKSCGMNRKRFITEDIICSNIAAYKYYSDEDEYYTMLIHNADVGAWKRTHTFHITSADLALVKCDEEGGDYVVARQRLSSDQGKILRDLASGRGLCLNM